MENTGRIIKGSEVKLEGTYRLGGAQSAVQAAAVKDRAVPSAAVQARIIESQPQYAIIEVICSCGTKTQIRCEYAEAMKNQ
ncbi:MAG: hypothetical protein A2Y12_11165 [Planctomycetes bacterium GWF2_42_9]|nr:MAG: hypothetical protein A2Y12_11165 [Planctomycetes bacterium GWF2_42_9]